MADSDANAIAIIGMAGRFPGADSVARLWANLCDGVESVTPLTDDELRASGVSDDVLSDPNYVKACAFLEGPDLFDAAFFDVTPREAELMDPQQRVFLECAWEAFEDAGYDVSRFDGAIGVFAGAGKNHYFVNNLLANPDVLDAMGPVAATIASEKDFVATRVSYKLDLLGPSVSVQTACSTSLVAVHIACQSLINGEADMVLAGGASISSFAKTGYPFIDGGIFSPDGHLRAFDAKANGQVGGNGAAAVVLKRLVDARADGDTIHAVIRGSALNNDGVRKVSFNAPGVDGQAEVVAEAMEVAGVAPDSIGYVECHGTGTNLGDPIEVAALTQAFRGGGATAKNFCGIGSLKTNVGHLDVAAGVAGLIKAALAIEHGTIPASLHFETPNPALALENSPFFVNAALSAWPSGLTPRRAGVSSFGMGGTNAHVVLEQAPDEQPSSEAAAADPELVVLSARTESALEAACARLADYLESDVGARVALADIAHTTQVGRKAFRVRRAIACADREAAIRKLRKRGGTAGTCTEAAADKGRSIAFLFSGQGTQFANMARGVYETEQLFRAEVDRCCERLTSLVGLDLRSLMFPVGDVEQASRELGRTQYTQPALFVIEYALAKQLEAWGIEPAAMLGHSIGEYVAACLAGVFTLDDALTLVAARGRLIGSLPTGDDDAPDEPRGGGMLAVPLPEADARALLTELALDRVSIAVVNAPELCVVAGPLEALEGVRKALRAKKVAARRLHTSHAFHSALMDPILDAFEAEVRGVKLSAPKKRVVSCTTGDWLSDADACDPAYWVRHLREPVRFAAGVETLERLGHVLLEVGPGQALTSLARLTAPDAAVVASSRHPKADADDREFLQQALGALWCEGVRLDWAKLRGETSCRRVPLPTYPFERRRYWIDAAPPDALRSRRAEHKNPNPDDWFYAPTWRRGVASSSVGGPPARVLVLADSGGVGDALVARMRAGGSEVVVARDGEGFDSSDVASYSRLFEASVPELIVHLLAADALVGGPDLESTRRAQDSAFFSVLFLMQALAETERAESVHVAVVTSGMQGVLDELCDPERALALGVCKAANAELEGIECRSIDLAPGGGAETNADALFDELAHEEAVVALRGGHRWLPGFEPIRKSPIPNPHPPGEDAQERRWLREKPVVLITGGLGGVGLALAEGLARDHAARLVLFGRTGLPERAVWDAWLQEHGPAHAVSRSIEAVRHIEAIGGEVLALAGDVAVPDDVSDAVARAVERFGAVHGVIHAAGVQGDGLLTLKTRAAAESVLAPKVRGTRVLDAALADQSLDFFVLCSSLATALDGIGQVDYFAANAFLDAFAISRARNTKTRVVSIAWEAWSETGMATRADVPEALRAGRERALRLGLTSDEGRAVFERALASSLPLVFVSTRDLDARRDAEARETEALAHATSDTEITAVTAGTKSTAHPRPPLDTTFVAPANGTQGALATIWADLIGIEEVGANDDFFALGGNSLLLMQVSSRLRSALDVTLSMRELFDTPTIVQLADRIDSMRLLGELERKTEPAAETEEFKL